MRFPRREVSLLGIVWILQATAASKAKYGGAKSPAQCQVDHERSEGAILAGKQQPYAFFGASEDCQTLGCVHPYWGNFCRFKLDPNCPLDLRHELIGWLRYWSDNGAVWARDILLLQPCDFWPLLKGRTTWVIGDSMIQDAAYTLLCFLMEYALPDLPADDPRGPLPNYSAHLLQEIETDVHNKRVAYWCRGLEEDTKICYLNADYLDRANRVLHFLPQLSSMHDIVIMNVGMHFNDMKELHEASKKLRDTILSTRNKLPHRFYWKETTPQHFSTNHGMLNMSRPAEVQRCAPPGEQYGVNISIQADQQLVLLGKHAHSPSRDLQIQLTGGHRNHVSIPSILEAGIKILPHWNLTLPLWQYHRHINAKGEGGRCAEVGCDCTHTCAPSWGQLFLASFRDLLESDKAIGQKAAVVAAAQNPMERLAKSRASQTDSQGV